jgi:D-amino peptidase
VRIAIVFDMEGTSHISDWRELLPTCAEYWSSGRQKLTANVSAAASGLLEGGATEVVVVNHHGAGEVEWPNIIEEALPPGVRSAPWEMTELRDHTDAMFQVGCHACGGSPSFVSHTILPGLRLRHRGELISESHEWAWTSEVPVIGMVGSSALGSERGSLSSVPYLAVQESDDRRSARPVYPDPEVTAVEIAAFARDAARQVTDGLPAPFTREDVELEASLPNGDAEAETMQDAGWVRTSATEFVIRAPRWADVVEAIDVAADSAWVPYSWTFDGLDVSTERSARSLADALGDRFFEVWDRYVAEDTARWIEPRSAGVLEGSPE